MKHGFSCGALVVFISCFALSDASFAGIEIQAGLGPSLPAINMTDTYSTLGFDAACDIAIPVDDKWAVEFLYSFNRIFPYYDPFDDLHTIGVGAERRGAALASGIVPYSVLGIGYVASPHAVYDGWSIIGAFGARLPMGKTISLFLQGNVVIGGPGGLNQDAFVFFPLTVGLQLHGSGGEKKIHHGPRW